MDRRTALDILEVVRPDSDDLRAPEVIEAAEFLAGDAEAEAVFLSRQAFDREVGRAMRDVAVPTDLKGRLLEQLAATAPPPTPAGQTETIAAPEAHPPGGKRLRRLQLRRLGLLAATAAACVLIAFGLLALRNAGRVDMADLLRQSPFEGTAAPFRGEFRPVLPHEFTRAHNLGIVKLSQPLSLNGNRQQAAYRFVLPLRRRQIEGVLLVAPVSSIRNPPPAESFHAPRSAGYGTGGFTTVAWTKGGLVYVCYVRGGGDAMETVRRALAVAPA